MDPITSVVSGVAGPLFGLIDNLFTSDEERMEAKRKLLDMEQQGKLDALKTALSAILAEAQSADPWTSRARPTFLYVIYVCILAALPMGVLFAFQPVAANAIAVGFGAWLNAIPDSMWGLFGAGYLGYSGFRSWDKKGGVK